MKKLIVILFLFFSQVQLFAKTYYVSNSGSDNNTGLSTSTSWKTLAKVSSFTSFSAGDQILFNRGDIFFGTLTIHNGGSSGNNIFIGAYGSGEKPVFTGFTSVTSWTNLGSNIWESSSAVSSLAYTNEVAVKNINSPMGRYPNSGYMVYQSRIGNTSVTSAALASKGVNWTGAEVVFSTTTYRVCRSTITSQSGGTVYYNTSTDLLWQTPAAYVVQKIIIQNDPRTLDSLNEWYYNPSTKKLRIYSTSTPSNVQIATSEEGFNSNGHSYLTVDNISFQGINSFGVDINNSKYVTIQNCDFDLIGRDAINSHNGTSSYLTIQNCTINHSNNNGINFGPSVSSNVTILSNSIKNIGMVPFMMDTQGVTNELGTSMGIICVCPNTLIQNNSLDSIGYVGVYIFGNNSTVNNNFINHFCLITKDGGGVYSWDGSFATMSNVNITNNIIMNASTDTITSHAVLLDIGANNINVKGNTMYNSQYGITINGWNINVSNNTFYDNQDGAFYVHTGTRVLNNVVRGNIFFAKIPKQYVCQYSSVTPPLFPQIASDSNYFCKPISTTRFIQTDYNQKYTDILLPTWQTTTGQDMHSKSIAGTISDTNKIVFQYNPTNSAIVFNLGAIYKDAKGTSYAGSIKLLPYTSAILMYSGPLSNQPPAVNAGSDQNIILPKDSVSLSGSATDATGSITSYSWSKVSGPSSGIIGNNNSAATIVNKLVQGTYKFQLKVTDNLGLSGYDTISINVNPVESMLPSSSPAGLVNGLNYSYYESANGYESIPSFTSLTPIKTGISSTFDLSLADNPNYYAFNFTGYINIPADGQYTFYTNSDDGSNLYIDNKLVVNNDGNHGSFEVSGTIGLKAGYHTISVGYFQQLGDAQLIVSYAGPNIPKQVIPSAILFNNTLLPASNISNLTSGLYYSYYESGSGYNSVPVFSTLTPVKNGNTNNFNLSVAKNPEYFSINFKGYITIPSDGQYTFYTGSDDGSKLYIDNQLIVNNDGNHGLIEASGSVGLKSGYHAITVGYFQQLGGSQLIVSYSGNGISKQSIPSSVLYKVPGSGNNYLSNDVTSNGLISNLAIVPEVKVYPNPFVSEVNVVLNGTSDDVELTLINSLGQVIWKKSEGKLTGQFQEKIPTSRLQPGAYFVRISNGSKTSVIKLIK